MKKYGIIFIITLLLTICIQTVDEQETSYSSEINKINYLDPNTTTGVIEINNITDSDENIQYTYNISISSVSGAIKYSLNGIDNYKVFNARGEATFTINANDKIIIYELPIGEEYTITQNAIKGYITSVDDNNTNSQGGIVSSKQILNFNNKKQTSKNPETIDSIWLYGLLLGIVGLLLLILSKIKLEKYVIK